MSHWRLTINRSTLRATVELKQDAYWKPWRFFGVVASEQEAERLIRAGWPDADGNPTRSATEPFTLEVVR